MTDPHLPTPKLAQELGLARHSWDQLTTALAARNPPLGAVWKLGGT